MKLNWMQMVWFVGTILFFAAVLLDITNVINIPVALLIVVPIVMFAVSVAVGPSFKEINQEWGRSKRRG